MISIAPCGIRTKWSSDDLLLITISIDWILNRTPANQGYLLLYPRSGTCPRLVKWGASSQWSFGPDSSCGSIVTTNKFIRKITISADFHTELSICLFVLTRLKLRIFDAFVTSRSIFAIFAIFAIFGARTPSRHFSIFSIGSLTYLPPSAHAREIRKFISFIRHSMYFDSVCRIEITADTC